MGIGLEMARQLLREGARVLVCSRNMTQLEEVKRKHPSLNIVQCDVTDRSAVDHLLSESKKQLGGVDMLINNAAIYRRFSIFEDYALEKQFQEIDINVKGVIQTTSLFLPELMRGKEPVLINLTSPAAFVPLANAPVYSASKAAVSSYTVSVRYQLRRSEVRVVLLCPPAVDTRMNKDNPGIEATNLMSRESFVTIALTQLKKGDIDIYVKPIGMFRLMNRFAPKMAFKMINKEA